MKFPFALLVRVAQADRTLDPESLQALVKERIGSVKTAKQIEIWLDLPRSKVGKVLKTEIKASLDPLGTPFGPALAPAPRPVRRSLTRPTGLRGAPAEAVRRRS